MIQNESIQRGSIITSFYNIIGKMLNFISLFLISYYFGANRTTDIYYLVLSFVILISALLVSQQSTVFLPIFVRTRAEKGEAAAWKFANTLITYTLTAALLFSLVFFVFSVQIVKAISKFTYEEIYNLKSIIMLFSPIITLYILCEFFRVIIQSYRQFAFPAKTMLLNGICNVLIMVFFHAFLGVLCLVVSLIISYTFQIIVMIWYIRKYSPYVKISFVPAPETREFFSLGLPVFIAQIFGSSSIFFYDYMATMFDGGTLTAINFAQKIYNLPNDMIITPLANVSAPFLTEYAVLGDYSVLAKEYIKYNNMLWFILIPVSVIFISYSQDISKLLFLRGELKEHSISIVSSALKYYSINIFGLSFIAISTKLLYSIQKTYSTSIMSICIGILSMIVTYIITINIGYIGIPLSRTFSVIVLGITPLVILSKLYIKKIDFLSMVKQFVLFTLISIIAIIGCHLVENIINMILLQSKYYDGLNLFIKIAIVCIVFPLIYVKGSRILKLRELNYLVNLIDRVFPHKKTAS